MPNAPDPIALFKRWFAAAKRAGIAQPNAMALATATPDARPSVRMVLLKGFDARGFVFFTDGRSRKGRELAENPHVAAVLHWDPLGRQVRIEGPVAAISAEETDAYWYSRPRGSQLSGATSHQSAPLASRDSLVEKRKALARRTAGGPVPRPEAWTGFRIDPQRIEFWREGRFRLHHREVFTRTARGWKIQLLQP